MMSSQGPTSRPPEDSPSSQASSEDRPKTGIDWADPSVLVGNSPPRSRWPLVLTCGLWVACLGFLVAMMVVRLNATVP